MAPMDESDCPPAWVGIDLDGTIAEYHGWVGPHEIGEPIPATVELVKRLLARGMTVKVFTARMWTPSGAPDEIVRAAVAAWTQEHVGQALDATCMKDPGMIALFDDRAVAVEKNTGRVLGGLDLLA
jgi:hypothetical protein